MKLEDQFSKAKPTTKNTADSGHDVTNRVALGVSLRRLEVEQVHRTPPSKPPPGVYVKILSGLPVPTDQKRAQSSLTHSCQLSVCFFQTNITVPQGVPFASGKKCKTLNKEKWLVKAYIKHG